MNPRALVAGSARVAWRRAAADRWLLLGAVLLVAVTAFLALTGPRLVAAAADESTRTAVSDAGSRADVVANLGTVGGQADLTRDDGAATVMENAVLDMQASLPPEVRAVTGDPSAALLSGRFVLPSATSGAVVRFAWLWRAGANGVGVSWVEGVAPQASPEPVDVPAELGSGAELEPGELEPGEFAPAPAAVRLIEVGLTRAGADALGAHVGDHLAITGPTRGPVQVVLSGIYSPVDAADPLWTTVPGLLTPTAVRPDAPVPSLGLLLSDDSLPDIDLAVQPAALTTRYRFPADASSLVANDVERLRVSASALVANPSALRLAAGAIPTVTTELPDVLSEFEARLRGASAQASVLLVGLVTAGGLALLLAARLVVGRRQSLLAAERARGGSVASVALRLALESVPLAVLGVSLGVGGSWLVNRAAAWTWWPGLAVAAVAMVAVPLGGARVASVSWTGRRTPANRKDRDRLRGRRRARRTVVELALVALALAATSAVRGRGLQQTQTQGVDLLLAATPVLLAGAATVAVLRVFPAALGLVARAAARRRGLIPLVAAARATRMSNLGLPLLALTVSLGLLVFSGVTAASAQRGEERAAAEVVGADIRLDGDVTPGVVATLRAADGVTALAQGTEVAGCTFNDDGELKTTVLAVDATAYGAIAAAHSPRYAGELAHLAEGAGAGGRPRAVVSPALANQVVDHRATIFIGGASVELDVVGTTDLGGPGEPLVIVDRTALAPFTPDPVEPEQAWVDGGGAVAAIAAASVDGALTGVTVTDRALWLAQLRDSPLVRSVVDLLVVTAFVLALYAALALVLTVTATSTERGRTLSSLRTLGLDRAATWRITLGELAPLTAAGAVAGAAIGLGVPVVLAGSLGLNQLTGEARVTEVVVTAGPLLLAAGASLVALAVSVVVEAAVRRRENLGEILRVGER